MNKEEYENTIDNKADRKDSKDAAKAAAALTLTAALALGSLFSGPEELTAEQAESILNPQPVVLDISSLQEYKADEPVTEETKKSGIRDRLRAAILELPLWTRSLICVPLQALGALIIWISGLLASQLAPAAGILTSVLIVLAVTAVLFGATAKLLFPDMSLKDIFSKKRIGILLISGAVIGVADFIASRYMEGYLVASIFVKITLCLLFVNISIFTIRRRRLETGTH